MSGTRRTQPPASPAASLDLFASGEPAIARSVPASRAPEAATGETAATAVSVATLTRTIKDILEGAFEPLWVRGEVSDFKQHKNGHWYFSLRDKEASLRCVVWAKATQRIPAPPDEGMTVVALGQVTVYASRGDVQFTVHALDAVGDGLWRKAFERTRARLEKDGLLDPSRRRPLPFFPRCIAVITSADGAALHDIISVARRRNPLVELVLVPAAVQGEMAPRSLCGALDRLARWGKADLAIVSRGGGSREDLQAFNDEHVARRVAAFPVPIISAVGHEVDISICDLAADWRAATPSAAAERAVPLLADLRREARMLGVRLNEATVSRVRDARFALESLSRRTTVVARRIVEHRTLRLESLTGRLHALSPLATMTRGYVVASDAQGRVVTSVDTLAAGDLLTVRFRDGLADARVERVIRTADEGEDGR